MDAPSLLWVAATTRYAAVVLEHGTGYSDVFTIPRSSMELY
jgi:hypothetical protein